MIFWQLFITFLKIGAFTFGGGYAMIALIQNEVVVNHLWLTSQEFTDILAISQMTPGPIGINTATYAGYTAVLNAGYAPVDRKSTRLNSSHQIISYAVFCLKNKNLLFRRSEEHTSELQSPDQHVCRLLL